MRIARFGFIIMAGMIICTACNNRLNELESRVDALEQDSISELREQLENVKNKIDKFESVNKKLSEYDGVHQELSESISSLSQTISEIRSLINETDGDLRAWVEKYYATKQLFESLQKEFTQIKTEVAKISGLESSFQSLADEISDCIKDVEDIRNSLEDLTSSVDSIRKEVSGLITSVQSISVVPDYSDGSAKISSAEDNKIRIEVLPLSAARRLVNVGSSVFSFDYVETQTKAGDTALRNLKINEVLIDDSFVVMSVDGRDLTPAVINGSVSANARARISDGTVQRGSSFVPLTYERVSCSTIVPKIITQTTAHLSCVVHADILEDYTVSFLISTDASFESECKTLEASLDEPGSGMYSAVVTKLLPETRYYFKGVVSWKDNAVYGMHASFETLGYPAVDFGLSVKWGTFNLGATRSEESGDYYAWGECVPKDIFTQGNYQGLSSDEYYLTSEYDPAALVMGGDWRMPTEEEIIELLNNTNCSWVENYKNTGVPGLLLTSTGSEDELFFPATGYKDSEFIDNTIIAIGSSISLDGTTRGCTTNSEYVTLHNSKERSREYYYDTYGWPAYFGFTIRPVKGPAKAKVEGIEILQNNVEINIGESIYLKAKVFPENACLHNVWWEAGEELGISSAQDEAFVQGLKLGTTTVKAFAIEYDSPFFAECTVNVKEPKINLDNIECIDLGLSVLWASFNLGAAKDYEKGIAARWGEITAYNPSVDYKWIQNNAVSKYNIYPEKGIVDNLGILMPEDDIVTATLGSDYHMPTSAEWRELLNNTYRTWTDNYNGTGVSGVILTSTIPGYEERFLFFPYFMDYMLDGPFSYMSASGSGSIYWAATFVNNNAFVFQEQIREFNSLIRPVKGPRNIIHVSEIHLPSRLEVRVGNRMRYYDKNAHITPEDATLPDFCVQVDENDFFDADGEHILAKKIGSARVKHISLDGGKTAETEVIIAKQEFNDEYVDLGLKVKWAACNLGALTPEEAGASYRWAETEPSVYNSKSDYKYWDSINLFFTKYYPFPDELDNGKGLAESLDPNDDPAKINLGSGWRIPNMSEMSQLATKCSWNRIENYKGSGTDGYLVTGPNGNSIFIPDPEFEGCCLWICSQFIDRNTLGNGDYTPSAVVLRCGSDTNFTPQAYAYPVYYLAYIRPVYEE